MNKNYFMLINRILTSSLAGVIAGSVGLAIFYLINKFLNNDLSGLSSLAAVEYFIILTAMFVVLNLYATLENYFYYLLDKERYAFDKQASLYFLIFSLIFAFATTLVAILFLTKSNLGVLIGLGMYVLYGSLAVIILREKNSLNLLVLTMSSLMAVAISSFLTIVFAGSSVMLAVVLGFFSIALIATCNSLTLMVLDLLTKPSESSEGLAEV